MIPAIPALQYNTVKKEIELNIRNTTQNRNQLNINYHFFDMLLNTHKIIEINIGAIIALIISLISGAISLFSFIMTIIYLVQGDIQTSLSSFISCIIWGIDFVLYYQMYKNKIGEP